MGVLAIDTTRNSTGVWGSYVPASSIEAGGNGATDIKINGNQVYLHFGAGRALTGLLVCLGKK